MRDFQFSREVVEQIRHDRLHHPHPLVQAKMAVLWLKVKGCSHTEIARLSDNSRRTVQRYLDEYLDGGLDAILTINYHKPTSTLAPHQTTLEAHFTHNPPRSVACAQAEIERLTGIKRSLSAVRRYLKRLGLKWLKTGQVPAKADVEVQKQFVDKTLQPLLDEAKEGKRVVLFVDASHFRWGAVLGYLWCMVRLFVRGYAGRKRYSVVGALNAVTHEVTTYTTDGSVNGASMTELLKAIRKRYPTEKISVVLDNARYHYHWRCVLAAELLNIDLVYLPTYSPNLNLIERLWKFVKAKVQAARHGCEYADFTKAIDEVLAGASTKYKAELDTLLTHNFQSFENVPILTA